MTDELFDRLLELSPDAMIVVGRDGKIVMVNDQTETMFGYGRAELIGKAVEMLIPKAARTRHRKHRAAFFETPWKRPMGQDLALMGKARDGREIPVDINLGPIETESGTLVLAAVRDVTAQRRAEAETLTARDKAAAAGNQLKSAIESITEGFVLFDSDGGLVLCNSAFRAFHGYSEADTEPGVATYESLNRLDRKRDGFTHKRRTFRRSLADLRRSGTVRITEILGERVIERRQEMTAEGGIISVQTDITDRKLAEAEVLAAKDKVAAAGNQLKSAIESISEGFVLYDKDGYVVLCNSAFRAFHNYSEANTAPGVATYESLGRIDAQRDSTKRKRSTIGKSLDKLRDAGIIHDIVTVGERIIERRQEMTAEGGIISVQTDITDRMWAEDDLRGRIKFSNLLHRITIAANQATSVEGVLQFCIDEICAVTGWPVGHVYLVVDDGKGDVMSSGLWRLDIADPSRWIKRFNEGARFTPGKGLIARVLAGGMPVWIADVTEDPTFERVQLAGDLGIKAGFAFPVLTGSKVAAIVEFFSRHAVEPDSHMLEVMAQIGTQLGRVIERRAAEDALRARIEAAGLLQKITAAANQAPTVEDALRVCLDAVCAFTGWPVGHVFMPVEGDPGKYQSTGLWHRESPRKFAAIKRATGSKKFVLDKGIISRVLASGKPTWIVDVSKDPHFQRAQRESKIGVKAAFAFPVLTGRDVAGVFEFFSTEAIEPDAHILDIMGQVGIQLGRVIERRAAQDALKESEERFRFVMDNSAAAINLKDNEGCYLLVNARFEEWYGLAAEDVIGKRAGDVFPQLRMENFAALEREVKRRNRPAEREFEIDFADGRKHLVLGSKFIVYDNRGEPMGIGTIETDITEPRQTEAQLRQAQKMEAVGQLTGGVAHDFNNLLAVISGNLDLLDEALEGDEKKRELLGWAISAADDAATLTQRLLAFSRQQPLSPRTLLANDLVNNLLTMLRRPLGEVIDIETDLSDALWLTTVDPAQFENALLNLVLNARDAMPDGGLVTIATANFKQKKKAAGRDKEALEPGDYIKLSVGDEGHGLSAEDLDRAFEPFFTTKEVGQGSGLGLSMVYGFSKQSGGHAEIESVEGQGATVSIYLPRASEPVAAAIEQEVPVLPRGQGEMILVVEDEDRVRDLGVRLLRDLGYEVMEAGDAKEAMEIIDSGKHIDLLFTDIVLPGGVNGRDLAALALPKRPALAVIYVSGYSAAIEAANPIEENVVRLSKPYRKKTLAVALRRALGDEASRDES